MSARVAHNTGDARTQGCAGLSLSPEREHAHDRATIVAELVRARIPARHVDAVERALSDVLAAVHRHFPENIFADLDHLGWRLAHAESSAQVASLSRRVVGVLRGFGRESAIRFRYVHDFLYGFDWARWVRKDPRTRAHVGPFDLTFLTYLERRQRELEAQVRRGDDVFGVLEPGAFRNPFCFAREPFEETALHVLLAERALIPVESWCVACEPRWDEPFTELRASLAERLGFAKRPAQKRA